MTVRHRFGSYEVSFETMEGVMPDASSLVVTDTNVRDAWPDCFDRNAIVLPPGEHTKCLSAYSDLVRKMAAMGVKRSSTVLAVGGGVVGDLAGFAAASFMRGIRLVQVPTTLLAMVDSSVGGKVGVDLPEGKNLVGAFWQPEAVRIALDALTTLPKRQFVNGLAEVWKYGFILEPAMCDSLADEPLSPQSANLQPIVERCIALKAQVVEEDELDVTGRRAILNFGHTVGHAIEQLTGYSSVLHGEAVAIGMVAEARIGEAIGVTQAGTAALIAESLSSSGLPIDHPYVKHPNLVATMRGDKKVEGAGLAFSLVEQVGRCKLFTGVAENEVAAVLRG